MLLLQTGQNNIFTEQMMSVKLLMSSLILFNMWILFNGEIMFNNILHKYYWLIFYYVE